MQRGCLKFVELFGEAFDKNQRLPFYILLSHFARSVPRQLLLQFLDQVKKKRIVLFDPKLSPFLLMSLDESDPVIAESMLKLIMILASEKAVFISKHLSSIIPNLLSRLCRSNPINQRMLSLDILSCISALNYAQIYPFRAKVISALGLSIDDHKRLVREKAARCRSRWYLLDGWKE